MCTNPTVTVCWIINVFRCTQSTKKKQVTDVKYSRCHTREKALFVKGEFNVYFILMFYLLLVITSLFTRMTWGSVKRHKMIPERQEWPQSAPAWEEPVTVCSPVRIKADLCTFFFFFFLLNVIVSSAEVQRTQLRHLHTLFWWRRALWLRTIVLYNRSSAWCSSCGEAAEGPENQRGCP